MKVSDIIEHIGHILIKHPDLLSKNDAILKQYGINFRKCLVGSGINILGCLDLDEKINEILDKDDFIAIKNNEKLALEIILKHLRNSTFQKINSKTFKKENLS